MPRAHTLLVRVAILDHPPLFFVNVADWDIHTHASFELRLAMDDKSTKVYTLCAAIYYDENHWTSRWIAPNAHVWAHDDRKHRGALQSHGRVKEPLGRSKFCSLRSFASGTSKGTGSDETEPLYSIILHPRAVELLRLKTQLTTYL
jgi:hypothetical protein